MDKYTYSLKVDKIQKLVRQEEYVQAAKIADTMEWVQERNVRLLTAVGEAYEKTGQYPKAIDVLLTAYERATIGKRIMYKLTELAIEADDLEDAETFYKKYLEDAPDENNRFILRYKIAEAKGEDLDKRITILETYRKYEFEEEWACRLAELYHEAGREKECVALCDEIILWFGVGPYVDKAMELKEAFQPLTDEQREHRENKEYYEARVKAVANEMAEVVEQKTADLDAGPEEEAEGAEAQEAPETEAEDALPVIAISDEVAAASLEGAAEVMLAPEPELPVIPDVEDSDLPLIDPGETPLPEYAVEPDLQAVDESELPQIEIPEAELPEMELPEEELPEMEVSEEEVPEIRFPEEELSEAALTEDVPEAGRPEEAAPEILPPEEEPARELLPEVEEPEEILPEEPSEEILPEPEEEPEAELPKRERPQVELADIDVSAEELADVDLSKVQIPEIEIPEPNAKKEPAELPKLKLPESSRIKKGLKSMPEPAIPEPEDRAQELEEAISAALEAEARKGEGGMRRSSEAVTTEEMATTRNLKDILRRTIGNASVPAPENLEATKEIVLPRKYKMTAAEREEAVTKISAEAKEEIKENATDALLAEVEQPGEPVSAEPIAPDTLEQVLGGSDEPLDDPYAPGEEETQIPLADDSSVLPVISYEETERAAWEQHAKRRIEEPEKAKEADPLTSKEMGNCIFVAAESGEEGVNQAVEALEDHYAARKKEIGAIAKILAEKLNNRGLVKSLPQLTDKDLIIDRANGLNNDTIREVLRVVEHLDKEKVFVLMDEAEELENLKKRFRTQIITNTNIGAASVQESPVEELAESEGERPKRAAKKVRPLSFDRMDPKQELSERDFIRYADYFAHELECVIDDSGFDALEDEIDAIRREGGRLLAGEVEDLVEDAAEHASKPTVRRVFGAKYDKDGCLILRGRDFR